MSRKRNTRYPHAFSKGRGVALVSDGSRRGSRFAPPDHRPGPCAIQTEAVGHAMTPTRRELDPRRWKLLRVSPTIAALYASHLGVAVICADCLHGVGHRNPGLPDRFRRHWRLTLLEIERRCRCEACGSRNARVYPWWGPGDDGTADLEGPPGGGR